MRLPTLTLAAAITLAAAGCKKNPACEKLVELSMKCDKDKTLSDGDKEQAKTIMMMLCENSFDGKGEEMQKAMRDAIKARALCAEKATTCEDWERCEKL